MHQRPLPWRADYQPYHVWVSEIMAQQTRMDVVLGYFARFLERFPTLEALAAATDDDVTSAWSGLGYYRRARMLRDGARYVVDRLDARVPRDVESLRTIPGIGRYTAGAIASIAFNERTPIVDGNVLRVLARVRGFESPLGSKDLEALVWQEAGELVAVAESPRQFNQALMELGASVCTPKRPRCEACPLLDGCVAFATARTESLPAPKAKPATRELHVPLYIVRDPGGRVLLVRATGPLMSGMFHLPHGSDALLPSAQVAVRPAELLGRFRHTITNRKVEFEVWSATLGDRVCDDDRLKWIDPDEMRSVPHPSYVSKALRIAAK